MEGRQGDRCSARVYSPLAAFAAVMSFRLRGVSLQKQADGAGFTSWLPSNVAELVLPLAIAIHLFPSPPNNGQSGPAGPDADTWDTPIREDRVMWWAVSSLALVEPAGLQDCLLGPCYSSTSVTPANLRVC